jgi:NTE family protein
MSDSSYGFKAYLPYPKAQRQGIALCVSGGGYRAALFHLGALRRLNELGVLSQVDTITSVSGGSIFAAQIAGHLVESPGAWAQPGQEIANFDDGIAGPMRELAQRDLRTRPVLEILKPWNWFKHNVQIDDLVAELAKGPAKAKLTDLPPRPRLVVCATDLVFRQQWAFDTGAGTLGGSDSGRGPLGDWTIAAACAASSCLPVAFQPMRVSPQLTTRGDYEADDRDALVAKTDLSDGGVYDNLGLEPVWRDHKVVLVSDAGPSFKPDPHIGGIWPQLRPAVTLVEQATNIRKRWLISGFIRGDLEGTYWGIASKPSNYPNPAPPEAYPEQLIANEISQVRIDLDEFSEGERAVLENHGYLMADIAVHAHAEQLIARNQALQAPFPDWMDPQRAGADLRDSRLTKLFGRG